MWNACEYIMLNAAASLFTTLIVGPNMIDNVSLLNIVAEIRDAIC